MDNSVRILITIISVLVIGFIAYSLLAQLGPTPEIPGETQPGTDGLAESITIGTHVETTVTEGGGETGTLRLLVSDLPADIGDFDSLVVTLSRTRIFGEEGFEEANFEKSFDLTQLIDEIAISVLEIVLPQGYYNKIELYASDVVGIVGGNEVDVKIPSDKLQITKPFVISPGVDTMFVFDINVVKRGIYGGYNLLPVIGQSGTDVDVVERECTLDSDCPDQICVSGFCVDEGTEPQLGFEEYFDSIYGQCQNEDTSAYPPPPFYYATELSFIDGHLIINDVFPPVGDLTLYVEPSGTFLFPNTDNGFLALDQINPNDLTVLANWPIDISTDITPTVGNRSNVSDDTIVFHTRNTSTLVQRDGHVLGNVSCGPASGTSLVNQINKTLNGTLIHPGNESVISVLRRKMDMRVGRGTSVWGVVRGLARFLNQSGLAGNYSIKYFGNYTYANGTAWNGDTSVEGTNISWRNDANLTWIDYITELFLTEEFVILRMVRTRDNQGHFVTADNLRIRGDVGTGEFHRFISFMDPWDGDIKELELTGSCVTLWGEEWCMKDLISVSPVE